MIFPWANETAESLKTYAQYIEEQYASDKGRNIFWKPANIIVDKSTYHRVAFDMVNIESGEFIGSVFVWGIYTRLDDGAEDIEWLNFYIRFPSDSSDAMFNVLYDCNACDTIGEYIYQFVDEVDSLTLFRSR